MNRLTKEIAQTLSVDLVIAQAVQDYMDDWYGLDYSEITQRELTSSINEAYVEMMS